MFIAYISTNRCWCLLFGNIRKPHEASITEVGNYGRFFSSRKEIEDALREVGLRVRGDRVENIND